MLPTVRTELELDTEALAALGHAWSDGGLWDDVLWLAARFWDTDDDIARVERWHHLVLAVGNFKRQAGRRLRPPRLARRTSFVPTSAPRTFVVPGAGAAVDCERPATWGALRADGVGTATQTALLAALWPDRHHVFDWRVLAAVAALGPLELVSPTDTQPLEPTIERYTPVRRLLLSVAERSGLALVTVERALYRLTQRVPTSPDRTWAGYRTALLAASMEAERPSAEGDDGADD